MNEFRGGAHFGIGAEMMSLMTMTTMMMMMGMTTTDDDEAPHFLHNSPCATEYDFMSLLPVYTSETPSSLASLMYPVDAPCEAVSPFCLIASCTSLRGLNMQRPTGNPT